MSVTVVTRIIPITANPEDTSHLMKPSDLGKPIEVRKSLLTDPRTGLKYNIETTYLIAKPNALENQKKNGVVPLTDQNALNNVDIKNQNEKFAISLPKEIPIDKISRIFSSSKLKELAKGVPTQPSIKLHLNLKKIREATKQRSISKKREKLVQPLLKYFVNNECLICGVILIEPSKNKILSHMLLHIKLDTYACQSCGNKCFPTADALFNHSVKHSKVKKYGCDMCNKRFSQKHYLLLHCEKNHPQFIPKPGDAYKVNLIKQKVQTCFVCTICKEKLTSWKLLLNHKITHSEKEGYLCLICNKSFPTSTLLRYHSHVRIILKRHLCKFCHKTFSTIYRLREHEKVHSRKVEFKCKICEKKFNFRNSLMEHIQLHS